MATATHESAKVSLTRTLTDEIHSTLYVMKAIGDQHPALQDLRTHIRGTYGTGGYSIVPHWKLDDLEDFELPASWERSAAYRETDSKTSFWLRADGMIVFNKRGAYGYVSTTIEMSLKEFTPEQLEVLIERVRALRQVHTTS